LPAPKLRKLQKVKEKNMKEKCEGEKNPKPNHIPVILHLMTEGE